jgi:putative membrane protein
MKGNYLVFGLVLALALAVGACNRNDGVEAAREDRMAISPAEQDFAGKAMKSNMAEIELARLAMQRTQNNDVRDYADMLANDHSNALEELTNLMKDRNIPQTTELDPEARQEMDRLTALSGPDFDREFVNLMVANHQKAVTMFREQTATARNPEIRKFAGDTLPTLESHLLRAYELQSKLFNSPRT